MKKLLVILTSVMFLGGQVFPALAVVGGVGGNDIKPNSVQTAKAHPSVFENPKDANSALSPTHATGAHLLHEMGYTGKGLKIAIIEYANDFNSETLMTLAQRGLVDKKGLVWNEISLAHMEEKLVEIELKKSLVLEKKILDLKDKLQESSAGKALKASLQKEISILEGEIRKKTTAAFWNMTADAYYAFQAKRTKILPEETSLFQAQKKSLPKRYLDVYEKQREEIVALEKIKKEVGSLEKPYLEGYGQAALAYFEAMGEGRSQAEIDKLYREKEAIWEKIEEVRVPLTKAEKSLKELTDAKHGEQTLEAFHKMAPAAHLLPIPLELSYINVATQIAIEAFQKAIDEGVDIINLSIRFWRDYYDHTALAGLLKKARDKGIMTFIGAGNDSTPTAIRRTDTYKDVSCFAETLNFEGVCTVGAIGHRTSDETPFISEFSALPSKGRFENIFLMAPGENLELAGQNTQGTSFASPITAGAYALLKEYAQKNNIPLTGNQEILDVLIKSGSSVTQHPFEGITLPAYKSVNLKNALKAMEERLAASKAKAKAEAKAEDEANAQRLSQAVQKLALKPDAKVAEAGKPLRALLQKENYSLEAVKAVMDGFLGKSRLHSLKLEVLDAVRKTNRTLTVDEARMGLGAAQGMEAYLQATNDPALLEANNRKIQSFQDIIDDTDPAKRAQKAEAAKIEELTQAVQKLGLKPDATVAEAGPKLRGFLQSNGYSPAAVKAVMDGFLGKSRLHSLKLEVLDAVRKTNRTLTVDEARMGLVAAQGMEAYLQTTNNPALLEANNRKIQSFQYIIDDTDPAKRAQKAEGAKIEELTQAVQKLGLKPNATVAEAGKPLRALLQKENYSPEAVKAVMDGFLGATRLFSLKVSLLETAQGIRPLNPLEARLGMEAAQALLKGANTPENKDRVNKFQAAVALSKTKPPPLAKPK